MTRMLPEDKLLLFCALPKMDEEHSEEALKILKTGVDWNYFQRKAAQNRVFPQTYENLELILEDHPELKSRSPPENMKKTYHQLMVTNLVLRHQAKTAMRVLAETGIVFTPFKGLLLDMLIYPENITRDFSDIDLFFPNEKERMRAAKALNWYGFKRVPHPHSVYHTIVRKRLHHVDVTFELHTSLPGITHLYQYPIIEDFWGTLEKKEADGTSLLVMPPENMVLVLALHAFREGFVRLKDVADLVAIIDSTTNFKWQKIETYMNESAWSYILQLPLCAYSGIKQILHEDSLKVKQPRRIFSQWYLSQSYPLPYSSLCSSGLCDRRCKRCLLLIQKEIPGFPDILSTDYFIRYFPARLRLSNHFIASYVRRDYGTKYALKCYLSMIKALVQIPTFIMERMFLAREGFA